MDWKSRYLSSNQFELYEELGKGGFGVVFRALDKVTKKPVAIKLIDLECSDTSIEEIQQEIKIMIECTSPQIVNYYGCFIRNYKLWIVMEYVDAGSCADMLASCGPFEEDDIATIMNELLLGISYLHDNGMIHRDIKAANILLNTMGDVKIADFGVSAELSHFLSRRNTRVGSPYWMPPEVIQQQDYNFKADIWSLGITAMELALGVPPRREMEPMKALLYIPTAEPPRLGNTFSPEFQNFVACCLKLNPVERDSARKLLKHKFLSRHGNTASLVALVQKKRATDQQKGPILRCRYVSTVKKSPSIEFDFDLDHESLYEDNIADEPDVTSHFNHSLTGGSATLQAVDETTNKKSDLQLAWKKSVKSVNKKYPLDRLDKYEQVGNLLNDLSIDPNMARVFRQFLKNLNRTGTQEYIPRQMQELEDPYENDNIEELFLKRWQHGITSKSTK